MSLQNGITYVSQPRTTTYNSQNAIIDLHHETGEYANVKIIINYPNPNAIIQEYKSGNLINQYVITNPYEIDYIVTDLDKIVITDSNSYNVIVTVQFIKGDPFILQLYRDIRFISISNVPNANIVSPLDNGRVAVRPNETVIEFTSLPFSVPANGRVVFQVEGTGNTATISFNDGSTTYQLNSGSTLSNGAIYEFSVAVAQGDTFTISGATFIRGFFIQEVLV